MLHLAALIGVGVGGGVTGLVPGTSRTSWLVNSWIDWLAAAACVVDAFLGPWGPLWYHVAMHHNTMALWY